MASCSVPTDITGGTVVTSGPYNDSSVAVFQCISGYIMSGTAYITCNNGTWTTSPSCVQTPSNSVSVTDTDYTEYNFPDWLVYFIAGVCGMLALAILTCILVCCLQLIGCYGSGGIFGEPRRPGWACCCKGNKESNERRCTIIPRIYEYDDDGRRFHLDDFGRRCYFPHRNRYLKTTSTKTSISPEHEHASNKTAVVTVGEVYVEKKISPAKDPNTWMPHANPLRKINTSTK